MTEQFHVLALDLGSFSGRCLLFDQQGRLIDSAQQPITLNRISPRWVEQDAAQIVQVMQATLDQVLGRHQASSVLILAAGIATQRSSIVAWRPSNGEILSPVLSWQDTRAYQNLERFQQQASWIQQLTGLRLTAHYGASKMQWLLEHNPQVAAAAAAQDCVITPLASLILFHICQAPNILIDSANAARTLLCNLLQQDWEPQLTELFNIDHKLLPRVMPIQHDYGTIKQSQIRVMSINGDQTAALYANGPTRRSSLYINLGTGAFVLTPISEDLLQTEAFRQSGLLAGISRSDAETREYYIEGTVNGAGAALDWLQNTDPAIDIERYLQTPIQSKPEHGVVFINAVGSIGSPLWRSDLLPEFIDDNGRAADRVSAVLESIVFLLMLNIEAMVKIKTALERIEISGGLSNNDYICQCLANLSGLQVVKQQTTEATARGIAWLAMPDHSHWINPPEGEFFQPQSDTHLLGRYRKFTRHLS
ncbi:MAG: FGGY family carbohydrate kinase [Gammaproteobacteria bacterium]|nr:FGGY family carbohydrate kinase [Gammaproteobacteria bacterium]